MGASRTDAHTHSTLQVLSDPETRKNYDYYLDHPEERWACESTGRLLRSLSVTSRSSHRYSCRAVAGLWSDSAADHDWGAWRTAFAGRTDRMTACPFIDDFRRGARHHLLQANEYAYYRYKLAPKTDLRSVVLPADGSRRVVVSP